MKIIPAVIDPTMHPPVDRAGRVRPTPADTEVARAEGAAQVSVSPSARAAAALAASGHYRQSGAAQVVEEIVGSGEPNAEFKEAVVGLLVGMMDQTDGAQAEAEQRAAEAEAEARAEALAKGDSPQAAAGDEGAPPVATALDLELDIGFREATRQGRAPDAAPADSGPAPSRTDSGPVPPKASSADPA